MKISNLLKNLLFWTLIGIITLAFLTGCEKAPVARTSTDNPEVPVDTLFEKDGCTVYRFKDKGDSHYYVVCSNARTTATSQIQTCGKNCTREVYIPTEYK